MEASNEKVYVAASVAHRVASASGNHGALQTLFIGDEHADLLVVCDTQRFKVHRAIVCPQSKHLEEQAKHDGLIGLGGLEPIAVQHLFEFLYTGTYNDGAYPTLSLSSAYAFTELILPDGDDKSDNDWTSEENGGEEEDAESSEDEEVSSEDVGMANDDGPRTCPAKENSADKNSARDKHRGQDPLKPIWGKPSNMLISHNVYRLAELLEIPTLQKLALDKLWSTMREADLKSSDFLDVVEKIYEDENIFLDDTLCDMPARLLAAAFVNDSMDMTAIEDLVLRHGALAMRIFKFIEQLRQAGRDFGKDLDENFDNSLADDE